ncbi:2758_t:CDS:2, partial [Gigaspora margarita]
MIHTIGVSKCEDWNWAGPGYTTLLIYGKNNLLYLQGFEHDKCYIQTYNNEAADPNQWDLRRWTIKKLKEKLTSRNISYEKKMDRDELVELLREYMCKETLTKPLNDDIIAEEMVNLIQQFLFNAAGLLNININMGAREVFKMGQEDPSNQYSSKDILAALEKMAKNGELTKEEIPTEKSIDSWISRYSRMSKQMMTKKILDDDIDF